MKLPKINFIWQSSKLYSYAGLYLKITTYDKQGLLVRTKKYRVLKWS